MAAGDDHLWQTQYTMFFTQLSGCLLEDTDPTHLQDGVATNFSTDWRDAFKRTYKGMLIQHLSIFTLTDLSQI